MPSLTYVGSNDPTESTDLCSRLQAGALLNAAVPGRATVANQISATALTYVTQTYLQTQMATLPANGGYYLTQDQLNLPLTQGGAPSVAADPTATPPVVASTGVATLDSDGYVPNAQLPAFGGGYVSGPYTYSTASSQTAHLTPVKFVDWNIGSIGPQLLPWCYATIAVASANAYSRPIVELRMSAAAATYANQTLISRGVGETYLIGQQSVSVVPVPAGTGQTPNHTGIPWSTLWISAWIYDAYNQPALVNGAESIVGSGILLVRGATS